MSQEPSKLFCDFRFSHSAMAGKRKATSLHDQSSGSQHSAGNATASSSGGEHSAGNFSLMFVDEDNFDSRLLPHLVYDQRPPIDPQELEETEKRDECGHCGEGWHHYSKKRYLELNMLRLLGSWRLLNFQFDRPLPSNSHHTATVDTSR